MKKLIIFALAFIMIFSFVSCTISSKNPSGSPSSGDLAQPSDNSPEPPATPGKEKTFGDVIEFDDLEITFSSEIIWDKVDNKYSDKNGMDVFLVPVTVKNVKSETHGLNMYYYTKYGSKGTKLDRVGSYFDNEIDLKGKLRSGASQEAVMAFLYDGDGDYYLELTKPFGETIEVKFPIELGVSTEPPQSSASVQPSSSASPVGSPDAKTFGDVIEFDDLEITFSSEIIWDKVDNKYSDKNGMDVFLVPVTVKNVKSETHGLNMFYYTRYGSKGTKLDSVGSYFDNEVGSMGNMRSGASQEGYMAFLYDGDGDYYVEFSDFSETVEVTLPIVK